jgi:signal transduction histidine kinase
MTRRGSLRVRLTAVAVLATAVVVLVVVVTFNVLLDRTLSGQVNDRLRTQAAAVATTVRVTRTGVTVRESPDDRAIDRQAWVFDGRRAVVRPAEPAALQRTAEGLAARGRGRATDPDDQARFFALPLVREGVRRGVVVTATSLEPYDRTTDVALVGTAALALLLLAAVAAVTWLTIGRALHPVTAMTRSAAAWSEHEPGRRFGREPRPDELGELARTFDALLDRVSAALRHEQRLSAELSHELRTPLARILGEVELLQRRERSPEERGRAHDAIARGGEQMLRILEVLMAAARAEAAPAGTGRSRLGPALAEAAVGAGRTLGRRGVRLEVAPDAEDLTVGVDAEVVERVLAPLLDNAGRYARAVVRIGAVRSDGRVLVRVADDGRGVPAEDAERVFEPGVRGATGDDHGGAGLGLPLARRLARAAGGDVRAEPQDGAGVTFVVDLPA